MAGVGAPWGSALSAAGFAALRSAGFEPVGQAFGAVVFPLAATEAVSCPGTAATTQLSGAALDDGYRIAIDRMAAECSRLRGHGVVGTTLRVSENPGVDLTPGTVEFAVLGTAVRVRDCPPLPRPFTTELSGADCAKLLTSGWVPAGIALGIAVAGLHDALAATSSGPWGTSNAEVPAYTNLMISARHEARNRLEQSIRALGADGAVASALTLRVRSEACRAHSGGTDHFARVVITATAVARLSRSGLVQSPLRDVLHDAVGDEIPDRRTRPHPVTALGRRDR